MQIRGWLGRSFWLTLFTVGALLGGGSTVAHARPGIECNCTATGDYLAPTAPSEPAGSQEPSLTPVPGYDNVGTSPSGKYQSTISTTGVLNVTAVDNGTTVLHLEGVTTGTWGFSPDDDRFVWWWSDGTNTHVRLYDLTSAAASTSIWSFDGAVNSAVILFSSSGKYLLFVTLPATAQLNLEVIAAAAGTTVHTAALTFSPLAGVLEKASTTDPDGVTWGFSPDAGDSLLTYAWVTSNGSVRRRLIALATDTTVLDDTITQPQPRLRFSPNAIHLLTATLNGSHTYLTVRDAHTGTVEYTDDFVFTNPPAAASDTFDGATWGFGTDSDDASLLYAWNTSTGVQLKVADLTTGTGTVNTSIGGGALWRFSPCGDLLAVAVQENASQMGVSLYRTVDGTSLNLGSNATLPAVSVDFTATDTEHEAITTGATAPVVTVLTPNTAGQSCSPADTQAPAWPVGSTLTPSNVTATGLTLSWNAATDNVGVTGYRIYQGSQQVGTVDGSTTYTVTGLTPSTVYTFTVQAGDAAGNWTTDGPIVQSGGDSGPPTWPTTATLNATDRETAVSLYWTAATDDVGVTDYRVYRDGTLVATVPGTNTYYDITGLAIGTTLSLQVEAGDAAGNWSTDGPSAQVTTTDQTPPAWNGSTTLTGSDFLPDATGLTLSWPVAQDNVAVTAYNVYRYDMNTTNPDWNGSGEGGGPGGYVLLGQVAGSTTSLAVTGLNPGEVYDFLVRAGDAAGNWTWSGPEASINTDAYPPTWPAGSSVTVSDAGTTQATVTWSQARDNVAVANYYVYVDGIQVAMLPADHQSFSINCLLPASNHQVVVQAADHATLMSKDGPSVSLTTQAGPAPAYPSTVLASASSSGEEGNADSQSAVLSADGRHVGFDSDATNLVPGDTNGAHDAFVHDLDTGITERVSISSTGVQGNENSDAVAISADGNFVLFDSFSYTLVEGDTNRCFPWSDWDGRCPDVFLRDRRAGTTERVNLSTAGAQAADGDSLGLDMTPDARFVLFSSNATNLASGDYNGVRDIFLRDRKTQTTELVSISTAGNQGDGQSVFGAVSDDGRYVVFDSYATNLDDTQAAPSGGIYLKDRELSATRLIIANATTPTGSITYDKPAISGDGSLVAFTKTDSASNGAGMAWQVQLYDRTSGTLSTVSPTTAGEPSTGISPAPDFDGRRLAFAGFSTAKQAGEIYVYNPDTGATTPVSVCSDGSLGSSSSFLPSISAGGHYVAFESKAVDLIPLPADANNASDIFVHDYAPFGDVDENGRVDLADVLQVLQMATGQASVNLDSCDVAPLVKGVPHPDGRCDLSDALQILQKVAGLASW